MVSYSPCITAVGCHPPENPKQPGALFSRRMFWLKLNYGCLFSLQLIQFQAPAGHIHNIAIGHLFRCQEKKKHLTLEIRAEHVLFGGWKKILFFPNGGEKCVIYAGRIRKKSTKSEFLNLKKSCLGGGIFWGRTSGSQTRKTEENPFWGRDSFGFNRLVGKIPLSGRFFKIHGFPDHKNQVPWQFCCLEPHFQPFINGCFSWMIPNFNIENGCFTKHPFINGCLGFQVLVN